MQFVTVFFGDITKVTSLYCTQRENGGKKSMKEIARSDIAVRRRHLGGREEETKEGKRDPSFNLNQESYSSRNRSLLFGFFSKIFLFSLQSFRSRFILSQRRFRKRDPRARRHSFQDVTVIENSNPSCRSHSIFFHQRANDQAQPHRSLIGFHGRPNGFFKLHACIVY